MEPPVDHFVPGVTLPAVQLRHDLPDGDWHVDWMIATDADGEGPLVAFRVPDALDRLPAGREILIERIGPHRPHYLDYEGPLSGGRGYVTRLAHGEVTWSREPDGSLLARMLWRADREEDVAPHALTARLTLSEKPDRWRLVLTGEVDPHRAQ